MRKLYRSTRDRKLFGVCGGLAEYLGVDATLLRILLIVVTVFSAGSVIIVYLIAGFVVPRETYYAGDLGNNPYDQGWKGNEQPYYGQGNPNWAPPRPAANPVNGNTSASGFGSFGAPRPGAATSPPPTSSRASQGIDAMMEDIEKKSLQREIEELKARISKFENQSKGE